MPRNRSKPRHYRPVVTVYRHPVTSQRVEVPEGVDAELQCLEQGGQVPASVLARMKELTSQSAQNRARIVKRLLGADLVPPVTK